MNIMNTASAILLAFFVPFVIFHSGVVGSPPYTYQEGAIGRNDKVFVDCCLNKKGAPGGILNFKPNFNSSIPGTAITYINVDNLKPDGQKGTVTKTGGGLNQAFVIFDLNSVENHGFLFQFKIYGHQPAGKNEPPLLGSCT